MSEDDNTKAATDPAGRFDELVITHRSPISKKQRRKIRSNRWHDMRPHIFDRVLELLPHTMHGFK